jgi:hypothetical protein
VRWLVKPWLAEQRIQAFEAEIQQPLQPGQGKRTDLLRYPDNDVSDPQARQEARTVRSDSQAHRGNTGYLMARLQRLDPEVADPCR